MGKVSEASADKLKLSRWLASCLRFCRFQYERAHHRSCESRRFRSAPIRREEVGATANRDPNKFPRSERIGSGQSLSWKRSPQADRQVQRSVRDCWRHPPNLVKSI